MPAVGSIVRIEEPANQWNETLYAFLPEKKRRSGSRGTIEGYAHMFRCFPISVFARE